MSTTQKTARWYMIDKDGMATLCTDREDAEKEAKKANMAWPHTAPHRAVQLVEVGTSARGLIDAAQAVIDRWDTPLWKDAPATAGYIAALREALEADRAMRAAQPAGAQQPGADYAALPYKQALGSTNCMQCCVSYMMGLPLENVPDFATDGGWERFSDFAETQGYVAVMLPGNHEFEADYLASGTTERGTPHMVVMNDGKLVHDPHPSNAGLVEVQCVWLLAKKSGPQWHHDERAAFEASAKTYTSNVSFERDASDYVDMTASLLWHGWKLRASHGQAPAQAAPAAMHSDLRARCVELLAWRETGTLPGEALRTLAREKYGDRYDALQRAERDTETEALNLVAAAPATQPAPQQEAQEPVAWYVTGCGRLLDEDEAKAEARRIGGTARAMPLYTVPQQDEALIRQLVGALEDFDDAGPPGEGWKSAPLLSLLASARARLEGKA